MRLVNVDTPYVNAAGTLRVVIKHDSFPMNPRKDMDNLGYLVADHRHYDLGDEDAKSELAAKLQDIADEDIDDEVVDCYDCGGSGESEDGEEVCNYCGGEGEIDNPRYVDTSDGPGLWSGLVKLDPNEEAIFRLPVYMYEHGGITLKTTPFSCSWDSGQLGFIWMTFKSAKEELGGHDGTLESVRAAAHRILKAEIEVYDQYVTGEVYGYVVEKLMPCPDDWSIEEWAEHDCHWDEEDSCWGFFGMDLIENGILDHLASSAIQAICEAEGITPDQLKKEQQEWVEKVTAMHQKEED